MRVWLSYDAFRMFFPNDRSPSFFLYLRCVQTSNRIVPKRNVDRTMMLGPHFFSNFLLFLWCVRTSSSIIPNQNVDKTILVQQYYL